MGRNKHPEQTAEKILNASAKLFVEKGYEKTSIQDILDALKLSKGGIYHHFKSKEDILEAVIQRRLRYVTEMLNDIIQNTSAPNAKAKLEKILCHITTDEETHALDIVLSSQIKNPQFIVSGIQNCVNLDAPVIAKLIEEGVHDGSIQTEEPALCAEIFLMLLNFWVNPILFSRDDSETLKRLNYLQKLMRFLGVDVMSDELITVLMGAYQQMNGFPNKKN